jgi:hypothetical protein
MAGYSYSELADAEQKGFNKGFWFAMGVVVVAGFIHLLFF